MSLKNIRSKKKPLNKGAFYLNTGRFLEHKILIGNVCRCRNQCVLDIFVHDFFRFRNWPFALRGGVLCFFLGMILFHGCDQVFDLHLHLGDAALQNDDVKEGRQDQHIRYADELVKADHQLRRWC